MVRHFAGNRAKLGRAPPATRELGDSIGTTAAPRVVGEGASTAPELSRTGTGTDGPDITKGMPNLVAFCRIAAPGDKAACPKLNPGDCGTGDCNGLGAGRCPFERTCTTPGLCGPGYPP